MSKSIGERLEIHRSLRPTAQNLVNRIYGDELGFAEAPLEHPLEKYLIAYDQAMPDTRVVRLLGSRIGISIPFNEDAPVFFAESVHEYLDNIDIENRGYIDSRSPGRLSTKEIIDMDSSDFYRLAQRLGWIVDDEHYQDRLIILSEEKLQL